MAIKFLNTVQVDTDVLYVDAANDRVGIGTTSPGGDLHVVGAAGSAGRIYLSDKDQGSGGGDALLITKTGVNSFVYNRDSGDLGLGSNNQSSYVNIKSTGNVGIGTTSPGAKLQVEGDGIFNGSVIINENLETLRLGTTQATGGTYQTWYNASGIKGFFGYASSVNDDIYLVNSEYGSIRLGTNGRTADFVLSADGNIGLGITSPGVKLVTVAQNYSEGPTLGSGAVGGQALLGTNGLFGQYSGVSATTGHVWHQVQRNDSAVAYNMILQPSGGNIGIGTATPSSKLEVDGGDIEVDDSASGLILKSPDGTRYRITVANGGTLSVAAV